MAESKLRELSMEFSVDIIHLTNQGFSPFSRWHLFCQHVPSVPVLKDAGRKTRDFLGFSSFFADFDRLHGIGQTIGAASGNRRRHRTKGVFESPKIYPKLRS